MGLKVGALVGVGILGVGVIFIIVGLATHEWITFDNITVGLWEICNDNFDACADIPSAGETDTIKAVRAMIILALLAGFAAGACAIFHVVLGLLGKGPFKILPILSALSGVISLILVIIGVIVYAEDDEGADFFGSGYDFGYSFALTIVGGILTAAGAILVFALGKED